MKKNLLFVLLAILCISFMSNLFAQVPILFGDGTTVNDDYNSPASDGIQHKAFRQQTLVLENELNNADGSPGEISSTPTGFFLEDEDEDEEDPMGSLSGTVTDADEALANATIVIEDTELSTVSDAEGNYEFPLVPVGEYTVIASLRGYAEISHDITITEDENTVLDFALVRLPPVSISGRVVSSADVEIGIEGAALVFRGRESYFTETDEDGNFTIPSVGAEDAYTYTVSAFGYAVASGTVAVETIDVVMNDIVLTEGSYPPQNVVATEVGDNLNIIWEVPQDTEGSWMHYGSDENDGTFALADNTELAIRFPASDLQAYRGMDLNTVKVWFNISGGTHFVRVWTGGDATTPGELVVDQAFTADLEGYNTIVLDEPVYISGEEEVWLGMLCNPEENQAIGIDEGPAIDGFGNMIYADNQWKTLLEVDAEKDFNWNIQGYVGFDDPTQEDRGNDRAMARLNIREYNERRSIVGYKVWRLIEGQEADDALWIPLTPEAISSISYRDTDWETLPDEFYKWAVRAEYTNDVLSVPAFSNTIERINQIGTLAGFVRDEAGDPIADALVYSGNYYTYTDDQGQYSMLLPSGSHTVIARHPRYAREIHSGIMIVTRETTEQDFVLEPTSIPLEEDFESYPDFATTFVPWTQHDLDGSNTYSYTGIGFPGAFGAMSFMIFNPGQTIPPMDVQAHTGEKFAACFSSADGPNNDWLITPQVPGGGEFIFWAKTFMDYGLERIKIAVSTTGTDPEDFTFIHGEDYIEVPLDWTEYVFNLSAYEDELIYVAINCVSDDCFVLKIDDVRVQTFISTDDEIAPILLTELRGNYPNPFNPETTINFSMKETGAVSVNVYNLKGQLVRNLVDEVRTAGNHSVVWNGKNNNGREVSSGVYYFKMNAGKYSSTKKMILMK